MTQADTRHGHGDMSRTRLASGWQRLMKPGGDVAPLPDACDTPGHPSCGDNTPEPWFITSMGKQRDAGIRQEQHGGCNHRQRHGLPGVPLTPPWAQNAAKCHHFQPVSSKIINTVNPEMSPYFQGFPLLQARHSGPFCPTLFRSGSYWVNWASCFHRGGCKGTIQIPVEAEGAAWHPLLSREGVWDGTE